MSDIIDSLVGGIPPKSLTERKMCLREAVQKIMLCGLSRTGFFKKAAFTGGTALHIFYGLDRFSEDLDFSLTSPDPAFDLEGCLGGLRDYMESAGLRFTVEEKDKTTQSSIRAATARGNAVEHLMMFFPSGSKYPVNRDEVIRIKLEVNVNPPEGATYETKQGTAPTIYNVRSMDMPSMFACKTSAVLSRKWKSRVKGRDLYDYLFFLSRGTALNTKLLENSLALAGRIDGGTSLTAESLTSMLEERFRSIDIEAAKPDAEQFVFGPSNIDSWDADFFVMATRNFLKLG